MASSGPNQALLVIILEKEGWLNPNQVLALRDELERRRKLRQRATIGSIALEWGYVSKTHMERAVALQKKLAAPPGEPKRLGYYLLEAGVLKPTKLLEVLEEQAAMGPKAPRIGQLLVRRGLLSEARLDIFLKKQAAERAEQRAIR